MSDVRESGAVLDPKYDANGLITAVVTDHGSGDVLMVAHMNAQALVLTQQTGIAHFWSRSRQSLWKKGETSGHFLHVVEMRIDCDQDALWVKADPAGPACHTGRRTCFYRRLTAEGLDYVPDEAD
ncbi:phosphoribosyl-AMP cyclohydrolase [Rhizorhapis suberifaciens]|uniref:Phosphoribosyl-AMP cyclohydrolase n=1 Tax=Rhizorhapis suberifaciens TaxID=13656 RepID=A0A840HPC0_9SPHN|nr:phosphoribosyl-AMP cyclohydrolase [Rhizorhapis suberifaciens]MBB4639892.1 phosphoribosyl-AMP cyclohydrolase [Rhizorhapis suberifaciens]